MGGSRNETIADCGLRNGNVSADRRAPLDRPTVALVRVAAALAEGRIDVLRDRFGAARAAGVPDRWIEELLLKSLLVGGSPLALVAFGVWREVSGPVSAPRDGGRGGGGGGGGEELAHEDWQAWAQRGSTVCAAVYGRAYHKLLLNLRALHPALEDLVLVDAYGKVIGRPGLDLQRRELCTVAAIAVLGAAQQLHSHLRGALNTGASQEEVEAVLAGDGGGVGGGRGAAAAGQMGRGGGGGVG